MKYCIYTFLFLLCHTASAIAQKKVSPSILETLTQQPDAGKWLSRDALPLQFKTHHTQGLLKIGEYFYLSAVEVRTWPRPYGKWINGYDRDTGDGTGHLFKFDKAGKLIGQIQLGEDDAYHPGGIDFDGKNIWVPVCEYRPYGRSVLYKVDPETMTALKIADCDDAIGGVAFNRETRELVGVNWDAEHFYRWKWQEKKGALSQIDKQKNPHHFIRYQDCQYIGQGMMICSGLRGYAIGETRIRLGGLQIIRLKDYTSAWETPVPIWVANNIPLNNNPFFAETTAEGLILYFIPEDDESQMYKYEVRNPL